MEESENLDKLNEELKQIKDDLIHELNTHNDCEVCFEPDKKMSEIIGDVFYNSMKGLFDVGAKLAKSLAGDIVPEKNE
jgi:hypothetical protein